MSASPSQKGFLQSASEILTAGPICDECLGRAFGKLGTGVANADRGRSVRTILSAQGSEGKGGRCWVCDGTFDRIEEWACRAEVLAREFEFDSYLFGVHLSPRLIETEALFDERFPTGAIESQKHAFNRALGRAFEAKIGRGTVDFGDPHLSFLVDLHRDAISLHVASLYILGRYRKLLRGIPQTRWPCRRCRGRGCDRCGHTGKQYQESVEELIAGPLVEAAGAVTGRLHGAGREDIDARMLGNGRPFVLELESPVRRSLDLVRLERVVNEQAAGKVEACSLGFVRKERVAELKETPTMKRYVAAVAFARDVSERELLDALRSLVGAVEQRTPRRVVHRRSDRVRERCVRAARGTRIDARRADIEFLADGGLYIKELVSGDDGRTVPSLSGRLGTEAQVVELDVVEIITDEATTNELGHSRELP